jgi:hypothetical protein
MGNEGKTRGKRGENRNNRRENRNNEKIETKEKQRRNKGETKEDKITHIMDLSRGINCKYFASSENKSVYCYFIGNWINSRIVLIHIIIKNKEEEKNIIRIKKD